MAKAYGAGRWPQAFSSPALVGKISGRQIRLSHSTAHAAITPGGRRLQASSQRPQARRLAARCLRRPGRNGATPPANRTFLMDRPYIAEQPPPLAIRTAGLRATSGTWPDDQA